jgi:hypothetical protein
MVTARLAENLIEHRSGVLPCDVKAANRAEHMRMLDQQLIGLFAARAAAAGFASDATAIFIRHHAEDLMRLSSEHCTDFGDRVLAASSRYRWT